MKIKITTFNWFDYLLMFLVIQFLLVPIWNGNRFCQMIVFVLSFCKYCKMYSIKNLELKLPMLFLIHFLLALIQGLYWEFKIV